jgi:hypothetical protein
MTTAARPSRLTPVAVSAALLLAKLAGCAGPQSTNAAPDYSETAPHSLKPKFLAGTAFQIRAALHKVKPEGVWGKKGPQNVSRRTLAQ